MGQMQINHHPRKILRKSVTSSGQWTPCICVFITSTSASGPCRKGNVYIHILLIYLNFGPNALALR